MNEKIPKLLWQWLALTVALKWRRIENWVLDWKIKRQRIEIDRLQRKLDLRR